MQNIIFKPKESILFLFCRPIDLPYFFVFLPVDQKIIYVSPSHSESLIEAKFPSQSALKNCKEDM